MSKHSGRPIRADTLGDVVYAVKASLIHIMSACYASRNERRQDRSIQGMLSIFNDHREVMDRTVHPSGPIFDLGLIKAIGQQLPPFDELPRQSSCGFFTLLIEENQTIMPLRDLESWMWAEACDMLDRADRLHRQFFRPAALDTKRPTWEPPVDVYETNDKYIIMIALPGVEPEHINILLENNHLFISGRRHLPVKAEADIRRLEIPYGRFERCIELPSLRLELETRELVKGCLVITLKKM